MRTETVGREPELAALGECLAATLRGSARLVLCQGEPGIGKTRLAEEFLRSVRGSGVKAAWGVGVADPGAPPHWPWRQVLGDLAGMVDLPSIADEYRLTADLPWLASTLLDSTDRPHSAGESAEDRFRQFDAVVLLLGQLTRRFPLVLVFDDMQWADQPSLVLLQRVTRSLRTERLLLVVNCRDTEPTPSTLADLAREPTTRQLRLSGLPTSAVGRQLQSVMGRAAHDAEIQQVSDLTGGNPFFVEEIGRTIAGQPEGAGAIPVTVNVRGAINARLGRLTPDGQRVLRAAVILGTEFSVAVVARMVDLPVAICLDALDEAAAAGLVEVSAPPGNYRFTHALTGDAIKATLGTADRMRLHRLAAEAIEHVHGQRPGPHLFELAHHWAVAAAHGEDRDRAVAWIQRAAEEAMRRQAYEEGARLFRLALDIGGCDGDEALRGRLLLRLGAALHLCADIPGGLEACCEAADLADKLGQADVVAEAALVTEPTFQPETDRLIRRLCEKALEALGPAPAPLQARVMARLAETCVYLFDDDTARRTSEEALALASECGDPGALLAALHARQEVCSGPDALDERATLAERMLAVGREIASPQAALWGHLWRIDAAFERGDLAAVSRENEKAAWCAQQVRGPMAAWLMLRSQAVLAQAQARFDDAHRLAVRASETVAPLGHPNAPIVWGGFLSTTAHHVGHDRDSLAAHGLADATAAQLDFPTAGVMRTLAPAQVLAEVGRVREAAALYRSLGPVSEWRPTPHATLFAFAFGILLAARLDATEDVAILRRRLSSYRGHHVVSGVCSIAYFGPVELWLGVAAAHLGLYDDAVADLDHAIKVCATSGAAGFQAEAQYELAGALARRDRPGDKTQARALVAESAQGAADLGMPAIAAKTSRLIEQLDAAHHSPLPLTRRELEVAGLVGEGLTNRQIADRLHLSERTAQNHVQHILDKLNLANRSQIAVLITGK